MIAVGFEGFMVSFLDCGFCFFSGLSAFSCVSFAWSIGEQNVEAVAFIELLLR